MAYQIGANNSMGSIGHQRKTLEEAKQLAQELKDKGFENVVIKDAGGNLVLKL